MASTTRRHGREALRYATEGALRGQAGAPLLDEGAARSARSRNKLASASEAAGKRAGDQCGLAGLT
eukprot:7069169-Alexandrium_andersonii.AAC.1